MANEDDITLPVQANYPTEWRNADKIEGWYKMSLFGGIVDRQQVSPDEWPRVQRATLGYIIRSLSRARIPDPVLVQETLMGIKPVPQCGWIDCFMNDDGDHVH
ncbi:MAG: hypothetical protein V3S30_09830 [Thermoanaerobaculia bacterium]